MADPDEYADQGQPSADDWDDPDSDFNQGWSSEV